MVLEDLPDWERLLAAERHLQALVPGSVLVEVLANLESAAGWQTSRVQRPVLILGHLDGVMTGIRQLRRTRPLVRARGGAPGRRRAVSKRALERAVVAWNRSRLDLRSDEVLAQILDRGDIEAWRELFAIARDDRALRERLLRIVRRVPLPYPCFWLAALASLGEPVDWSAPVPHDDGLA